MADGQVLGMPMVSTIGAGNALVLLDAAGVYVHDGGAELAVSKYAAIQAEASPDNPAAPGSVLLDLWSHNLVGVRLDRFLSWAREATAVAFVTVTP